MGYFLVLGDWLCLGLINFQTFISECKCLKLGKYKRYKRNEFIDSLATSS